MNRKRLLNLLIIVKRNYCTWGEARKELPKELGFPRFHGHIAKLAKRLSNSIGLICPRVPLRDITSLTQIWQEKREDRQGAGVLRNEVSDEQSSAPEDQRPSASPSEPVSAGKSLLDQYEAGKSHHPS